MVESLSFSLVFNEKIFSAPGVRRNKRSVERSIREVAALFSRWLTKNTGQSLVLPLRNSQGLIRQFDLGGSLFSRAIRVTVDEKGLASLMRLPGIPDKTDEIHFLEFLFLSRFEGDSASQPGFGLAWSRIKTGLMASFIDNGLEGESGSGDLNKAAVKNVIDALVYESYAPDPPSGIRETMGRAFYLFNTNYGPFRRLYSQNMAALLERVKSMQDCMTALLGFHYFSLTLKEMRPVDISVQMTEALNAGGAIKEVKVEIDRWSREIAQFIDTVVIGSFQDSILKDIKNAMTRSTGDAYQSYERILFYFDRKAYEDIFQAMKKLSDKNYLAGSRDYYLFYRIFAYSFFEVTYPGTYRRGLNETEQNSSRARFRYVSGYMNRLVVTQDIFRENAGAWRVKQTAKNIFFFCVALFAVGGIIQIFLDLVFRKVKVDLLSKITDGIESLSNAVFTCIHGFSSTAPGFFTQTVMVAVFVFFLFFMYFLYRSTIGALSRFVSFLRGKHELFFALVNVLVFFLCLNFLMEGWAFFASGSAKGKVLLISNNASSEIYRDDPFLKRFLVSQGIFSAYSADSSDISEINSGLTAKSSDAPDGKESENAMVKKLSGYSRIVFAVAPYNPGSGKEYAPENYTIQPVLNALIADWKKANSDREIILLYPLQKPAAETFAELPYLDRLQIFSCVSEYGQRGLAYIPSDENTSFEIDRTKIFGLQNESSLQEIFERLKNLANAKVRQKIEDVPFNIDYYYAFPEIQNAKEKQSIDEATVNELFLPLVLVKYSSDNTVGLGASAFYYRLSKDKQNDLRKSYGIDTSAELRIVAVDQKYLFMDSSLGEIIKKNVFLPDTPAEKTSGTKPMTLFFMTQAILLLFGVLLSWLMTYATRKTRALVFLAILASQLPWAFALFGDMAAKVWKPQMGILLDASVTVLMIATGLSLFAFFVGQIVGAGRNKQIVALSFVPLISQVIFWTVGIFTALTPMGLFAFLTSGWGMLVQGILIASVAVASFSYFSFKFRVR